MITTSSLAIFLEMNSSTTSFKTCNCLKINVIRTLMGVNRNKFKTSGMRKSIYFKMILQTLHSFHLLVPKEPIY